VLNALFATFPWVGTWLGPILRPLAEWVCDRIFEYLRLVIDLKVIKLVNDQHQAAFEREVVKLRILARTQGIDSEAFKKERQDAKAAFAKFVRFNGA
jgi:hypothetical protein